MSRREALTKIGRRKFLTAAGSLPLLTKLLPPRKEAPDGTKYNPKTEKARLHSWTHTNHEDVITNGAKPEREAEYGIISKDHWKRVSAGFDLRDRIVARLSDLTPTPRVAVHLDESETKLDRRSIVIKHVSIVTETGSDGQVISEPDYSYEKLQEVVKTRFPDEMAGVAGRGGKAAARVDAMSVRTEKVEEVRSGTNDSATRYQSDGLPYYEYEYRSVPAGCYIDTEPNGDATLGAYAFDNDTYTHVFVTAGHVIQGVDTVYQDTLGDSNDKLGTVNSSKVEVTDVGSFDAGVIFGLNLTGNYRFAADSANSYHGPEITGSLSEQGIRDLQGTNEVVYKQGCKTGRSTSSQIIDVSGDTFTTYHTEQNGDSGGPYWVERGGYSKMVGIHSGGDTYTSTATMIPSIESKFNLVV